MSVFQNSYLAESNGFATGHTAGIAAGYEAGEASGYTDGWNDAIREANALIAKKNRLLDSLEAQRDRLAQENAQLRNNLQLQQEQAQALRAEYEAMFKAFLGVVAIARPAMKAVAKMPLEDRSDVFHEYAYEAENLQTKEYTKANRFPDNQPLIKKYLPIAKNVFDQTYFQLKENNALRYATPSN